MLGDSTKILIILPQFSENYWATCYEFFFFSIHNHILLETLSDNTLVKDTEFSLLLQIRNVSLATAKDRNIIEISFGKHMVERNLVLVAFQSVD